MSSQISGLQLTLSPSARQKVEGEGVEEEPGMEEEDEEGGALEGVWKQQDWGTPGGTIMRPGATGKKEAVPITG